MATQLGAWFTGSTLTIPFGINCWAVLFANSGGWCNGIVYWRLLKKTQKEGTTPTDSRNTKDPSRMSYIKKTQAVLNTSTLDSPPVQPQAL